MIRTSMKGRELPEEEIENYKANQNVSDIAYRKETITNRPTMQVGYNENGTIKEVEIEPQIYELNSSLDIKSKKGVSNDDKGEK